MAQKSKKTVAVKVKKSRHKQITPSQLALSLALAVFSGVAAAPHMAHATPTPITVGQTITNPVTGTSEVVTEVINSSMVRTNHGNVIVLTAAVGDVIPVAGSTTDSYVVTKQIKDSNGIVIQLEVKDSAGTLSTVNVVTDINGDLATVPSYGPGGPGAGTGSFTFTPAAGDVNNYVYARAGDNGSNGHDGGGVRICFGILGCITIGVNPSGGGNGADGPDITKTIPASYGDIQTVSDKLPAIMVSSTGGNGGKGGNGYGVNIKGAPGGLGGAGGDVSLTNYTNVSTSGIGAFGILTQSRAGKGGSGGSGYLASGGGSGGGAAQAGTVEVINYGNILTTGKDAVGIMAQSLGGSSGGGGDSYGVVGDGGDGTTGGNADTVTVTNYGGIKTKGQSAHGIMAQSVGGSGGNAGDAGGLFTFGNSGSTGGNGGNVSIFAKTGSLVRTEGAGSYGLFAQSIGGGGGNGGLSVGIATLGSAGSAGGNSGTANITVEKGAAIETLGQDSHGLFVQSVGGGGGNAGLSLSAVTIGGDGDKGGGSANVGINSDGTVITTGKDSRGIFAQSVGGGGGSGSGVGGLVSIGGKGAKGGAGAAVDVTIGKDGSITTLGNGSDAIFAQSVGGGGGSGSSAGGVVALGGSGDGGGVGGTVTVKNEGTISTGGKSILTSEGWVSTTDNGNYARGIFAQSVGGGGGSGGDAGALVSIGGSAGLGSNGGVVTVTNTGNISTFGNRSVGIQAQSIGGGGGDGGSTGGVFLTIGGLGGGGGAAGIVTVNHTGNVSTFGNDSHAIFAQSVGGGGGNGGSATSISAFAGVAIGGKGAAGGAGGAVNLNLGTTTESLITTYGDRSRGIFAQSVGGGGGNGGAAAQVSAGYGFSASVAVGGSGSTGGIGGDVTLGGLTSVRTYGKSSEGIFAQSVGGGGGSGGYAVAVSMSGGDVASASFSVAVGGSGGAGGAGGLVKFVNAGGDITTGNAVLDSGGHWVRTGDFSTGLLAQSIGGGGGNGGFSVSVAASGAVGGAASVAVGIGGSGSGGGKGGVVDTNFNGSIITYGDHATGALIQSVGGGGGNGGFNVSGAVAIGGGIGGGAAVGVGGSAGGGGIGDTVTGTIGGDVFTAGDHSSGVIVQSIGGGGGNGGFNVSGAIGGGGTVGAGISVGIGGSGGVAAAGGKVTGKTKGTVTTLGDDATGLLVQSVGGGGGNGGFNVNLSIAAGGTAGVAAGVGIGGAGSAGGNGGEVTGEAEKLVTTSGDRSTGVVIQSIGGGGGNGGFNVTGNVGLGGTGGGTLSVGIGGSGASGGDGGEVLMAKAASIYTSGNQSGGFLAQSIGGGGGNGGFAVAGGIGVGGTGGGAISVGVGGSGSGGGISAKVTAQVIGDVTTEGNDSSGIVAQSIGGGGGNGGFAVAGGIGGGGTGGGVVGVGIGGSGALGGTSGIVNLTVSGLTQTGTTTSGNNSDGILAQSVGGGGGNGGFAVTGSIALGGTGAGNLGVSIGGSGGAGGASEAVTLNVTGKTLTGITSPLAVVTRGESARGIVAQSIGGGGGNGGFSVSASVALAKSGAGNVGVGIGGSGDTGGNGKKVTANVTGDVWTLSDDSAGILAQSLGGGGGNGGFNITGGIAASNSTAGNLMVGVGGFGGGGGDGGDVGGTVTGNVLTGGSRASGVTYQSLGGGGGNGGFNITAGLSLSGSGGGAGNIGVGVGGFGGTGGISGLVDAKMLGNIETIGAIDSYGALFQSVAGGGGNGGFNITGLVSLSSGMSGNLGVGIGGFGGTGGNAGNVIGTVGLVGGHVTTTGTNAYGVAMQSLGGGGGNGGINITGALSMSKGAAGTIGVGIGGFGGGAGTGGEVHGTVNGLVRTGGDAAMGVIIQSVGGGGGNGGINITGVVSVSKDTAGSVGVGIGGFGGGGGAANNVSLDRTGDTVTNGANSDGILVQSVGGGGGNGAMNITAGITGSTNGSASGLNFGLGGFGGGAGKAGEVKATVLGNVWATGYDQKLYKIVDGEVVLDQITGGSNGIVAQSVGGGGGNGGLNISGQVALTKTGGAGAGRAATIGIGGFGGGGGDGDTVDLTVKSADANAIQVQAYGDNKSAILAQSLGGGGGNGGIDISASGSTKGTLVVGIGGFGGSAGIGDKVTVEAVADLFAEGNNARGLMAQSIGGGGGAGGINISGNMTIDKSSDEPSIVAGLGGYGGAGNRAGDVTVTQRGQVQVSGDNSIGVLVQSVGGGGGSGGMNISGNLSAAGMGSGGTAKSATVTVGVGGTAGAGADAGDAKLDSVGNIFVTGGGASGADGDAPRTAFSAAGILVQSIGGGGGVGGMNINATIAPSGQPASVAVGGNGGSGGNAGEVWVTRGYDTVAGQLVAHAGLLITSGNYNDGLVAQSIGGGGGNSGMTFNLIYAKGAKKETRDPKAALVTVGGSGAGAGSGDDVHVNHLGLISTDGDHAQGLIAQSIGGGGGSADLVYDLAFLGEDTKSLALKVGGDTGAGGTGADVDVRQKGIIITAGDSSTGILAQSIGGGGGNAEIEHKFGALLDILSNPGDTGTIDLEIGRKGGVGGEAGKVEVTVEGAIVTSGDSAMGILAQSIGGGGGDSGTTSVGGNFDKVEGTMSVGLGGGTGAKGGDVTVTTVKADSIIATAGSDAHAIMAQSIGGGGGVGGSVGDDLAINTGDDEDAHSFGVNIGGAGGSSSTSGHVTVKNAALLATDGDRSDGIYAQSVGGSGGAGGDYKTMTIERLKAGTTTGSYALNVGGTGGSGAVGGAVTVTNTGQISTLGEQSYGIRADSIGGGGGNGGLVSKTTLSGGTGSKQSLDINVGGTGGDGGAAGLVTVTNEGLILTEGRGAMGIRATSTGGGGGDAGMIVDINGTFTGGEAQTSRLGVNLGGSGGTGGTGGNVIVTNHATAATNSGVIQTSGDGGHGIFAQSLGGGGGNGTSILSLGGMRSKTDSVSVGLNIGGHGGSGNTAGSVKVTNDGRIATSGDDAYGIFAQSIGGGGGNGGMIIAANVTVGTNSATSPMISIGGFGGAGGTGGQVDVINSGTIYTTGAKSHGIVAQSIGGGGGNAGFAISASLDGASTVVSNVLALGLGAFGGGTGGLGGVVNVTHSGDITVTGDGAIAIVAESINGGGGHLDFDLSHAFSAKAVLASLPLPYNLLDIDLEDSDNNPLTTEPVIVTRAGGMDVSNMNANVVHVVTTGTFQATGDNAAGFLSQSIGGGGGVVNVTTSLASPDPTLGTSTPIDYIAVLGGVNGNNNTGGNINGSQSGAIQTTGINSPAVLVQTIGGGGGRAVVDITRDSHGNLGQVTVSLGSQNGHNEQGGNIDRTQNGQILTTGLSSSGVILQSIGGGGGSASLVVSNSSSPSASSIHAVSAFGAGSASNPALPTVHLGANGGTGLGGGTVSANYSGGIATTGNQAVGLLAQSIGAGGGDIHVIAVGAVNAELGGKAGASGNGGLVSIINSGNILTSGTTSHGVILQSIGGGGGAVFGAGSGSNAVLSSQNIGDGGHIVFNEIGSIQTSGSGAYGLIAQSLGGGGGWVDGTFAGSAGGSGHGGAIDLTILGDVYASGVGSTGIFAQSLGSLGNGNIRISGTGLIRGNLAGISLEGGASNQITVSGSVSAVSGQAITATTGNEAVLNTGLLIGNINLGSGSNTVMNAAGATYLAYSNIDLRDPTGTPGPVANTLPGSAATFTNAGDFRMGLDASRRPIDLLNGATFANTDSSGAAATNLLYGSRVINSVALDGNFVQTSTGHMAFDVAFGPYASDKVNVTGNAVVAGTGTVTLTWLENAKPLTLFATTGVGVNNGLKIDNTLAMTYRIQDGASGIQLAYSSNFGQGFLNRNLRALGGHMDSAVSVGDSSGVGRLMALIGNLRTGEESLYSGIFAELNPEPFVAPLITQTVSAAKFSNDLFSCPVETSGKACAWGHIEANSTLHSGSFETLSTDSHGSGLRTGFEKPLNDRWSLAIAIGYNKLAEMKIDDARAFTTGEGFDLGLGFKRRMDSYDFNASLTGGKQWLKTQRLQNIFDSGVGMSKPETAYLQANAQVSKTLKSGRFFVQPSLGVSAVALHQTAFKETGLAGLGVAGVAHTQTFATINPQLKLGFVMVDHSDAKATLGLTLGELYRSTGRIDMPYRLVGSNPTSDPALIGTALGRTTSQAGVDMNLAAVDGRLALRLSYTTQSSAKMRNNTMGINFKLKF